MDKDVIIENTKKHIHQLRQNSPLLQEKNFKIALGKVLVELSLAKKQNNNVLKQMFDLKK